MSAETSEKPPAQPRYALVFTALGGQLGLAAAVFGGWTLIARGLAGEPTEALAVARARPGAEANAVQRRFLDRWHRRSAARSGPPADP